MAISARARPAPKKTLQYLTDEKGTRTAVVLSLAEYEDLIEKLEQNEDKKHLEKARKVKGKPITWEQMKDELRAEGKLP